MMTTCFAEADLQNLKTPASRNNCLTLFLNSLFAAPLVSISNHSSRSLRLQRLPVMSTKTEETRKLPYITYNAHHSRKPVASPSLARPPPNATRDTKPSFSKLPLVAVEAVVESLIARGLLKTLASLNATSKGVRRDTLPCLWRTVIWDPIGKTQTEQDECWKRLMIDSPGARHIQ